MSFTANNVKTLKEMEEEKELEVVQFLVSLQNRQLQLKALKEHAQNVADAPEAKGKFTCPICHIVLNKKSHLNNHIRTHTGEKPYTCQMGCGKSFRRSDEEKRHHTSVHLKLGSNHCPYCSYKTDRMDHLRKHAKTHPEYQDDDIQPRKRARLE